MDDEDVVAARDELARLGFYVEPTGAVAFAAYCALRRAGRELGTAMALMELRQPIDLGSFV